MGVASQDDIPQPEGRDLQPDWKRYKSLAYSGYHIYMFFVQILYREHQLDFENVSWQLIP